MTGGQVAALGCAIVLLLPGGCFLLVGISMEAADGMTIGAAILVVAALLFWVAFRGAGQRPLPGRPPSEDP